MQTLVVAFEYPWPPDSGPRSRLRLVITVDAPRKCRLTEVAEVALSARALVGP